MAITARGSAALVHDYFVQDGGAERVAIEFSRLVPDARMHTTFFVAERFSDRLDPRRVRPWRLNNGLLAARFRSFLPLYPAYFSSLDLRGHDLVISSSTSFAKAVRTAHRSTHIAYVNTPLRAAWQLQTYAGESSFPIHVRLLGRVLGGPLRVWDRRTARGPDVLVANSETVRGRIRAAWGRDSEVIHPPVDVAEFDGPTTDQGYLLVAARLLPYRRVDLAVDAARLTGRELLIVGDGPARKSLEARAGKSARFLGYVARPQLVQLVAECHAYLVPGEEDFCIAAVEAMAAGKPVVAFNGGGATETVIDGTTGVLFERQTAHGLAEALERLDSLRFERARIQSRAAEFDRGKFRAAFVALFERLGVDPTLYAQA